MRRCFRPGSSGRPEDSRFRFWSEKNDSGQEDEPVEGRMEWYESTGNRPYGSVGEGAGRMRCTETCDLVSAHTVRRPSPRIFSGRKMCLSLRSRRYWGIARLRLRCAICVWAWRKTLRFSPGAAASDCLPGLATDRIPGISSYTKEKALNISAFSCPGQGLIYENIYKQLKFEYIYNILKYSILKLYAMKCILSVFSCFAKMRTRCGHESIAVFESKSYLCRA